jgi:hypothetical protein
MTDRHTQMCTGLSFETKLSSSIKRYHRSCCAKSPLERVLSTLPVGVSMTSHLWLNTCRAFDGPWPRQISSNDTSMRWLCRRRTRVTHDPEIFTLTGRPEGMTHGFVPWIGKIENTVDREVRAMRTAVDWSIVCSAGLGVVTGPDVFGRDPHPTSAQSPRRTTAKIANRVI